MIPYIFRIFSTFSVPFPYVFRYKFGTFSVYLYTERCIFPGRFRTFSVNRKPKKYCFSVKIFYRVTCLWGALCQRKEQSTVVGENTEYTVHTPYDIPSGYDFKTTHPLGKKQYVVKTTNPAELFTGEYPRIGPFIQSLGRKIISETVAPLGDKVKRIHTDGFIVEGRNNLTTSPDAKKELGALKREKTSYCKIKHVNKITWKA